MTSAHAFLISDRKTVKPVLYFIRISKRQQISETVFSLQESVGYTLILASIPNQFSKNIYHCQTGINKIFTLSFKCLDRELF